MIIFTHTLQHDNSIKSEIEGNFAHPYSCSKVIFRLFSVRKKSFEPDLNQRPMDYCHHEQLQSTALPTELSKVIQARWDRFCTSAYKQREQQQSSLDIQARGPMAITSWGGGNSSDNQCRSVPHNNNGGVAQMVERSLSMREVPGSIPGASNTDFFPH